MREHSETHFMRPESPEHLNKTKISQKKKITGQFP